MSRKGDFFNQINPDSNMFENLSQYVTPNKLNQFEKSNLNFFHLKGNTQFVFLCNPKNHRLMFVS